MTERLVEDYLAAVARACAGLPSAARMELLADLREHIAVARAELPEQTEAEVRGILDRLGTPAVIAAEARASLPEAPATQPAYRPGVATLTPTPTRRSSGTAAVVVAAVAVPVGLLLLVMAVGVLLFFARVSTAPAPPPDHPRPVMPTMSMTAKLPQ